MLQLLDGVGPVSARRTIEALGADGAGPPGEVLDRWPQAVGCLPAGARALASELVAALPRVPGESTGAQAERLTAAVHPLIDGAYDDAAVRLVDLDALCAAAAEQERVSDVAADLTLEPPHSTGDLAGPPVIDEDWLVLSTIHSAKGLEWDVVHLIHAADGNLPSDMALSDREGLEEERRLFYVAVTRPARALQLFPNASRSAKTAKWRLYRLIRNRVSQVHSYFNYGSNRPRTMVTLEIMRAKRKLKSSIERRTFCCLQVARCATTSSCVTSCTAMQR